MLEFNCGSLEVLDILKIWIAYCKMKAATTIISSIMAPVGRQVFSFTKECSNKIKQRTSPFLPRWQRGWSQGP